MSIEIDLQSEATASGNGANADPRGIIVAAGTGLCVIQDGRVVQVNEVLTAMLGRTEFELLDQPLDLFTAPDDVGRLHLALERRLAGKTGSAGLLQCLRRDGSRFEARSSAERIEFDSRPAVQLSLIDLTDFNLAVARARWHADMLVRTETLCRAGSLEIFLPDGRVVPSPGLLALLGLPPENGVAHAMFEALEWIPADERAFVAGFWRHATPGEPFEFQHRVVGPDGRRLIVLHRGMVDALGNGHRGASGVAMLQDITAQREAELRAEELATHDDVTGLPNRPAFLDQLDAALCAAAWESKGISLLTVDIARIADVKARMGFGAGDTLAMALAARLQGCRRDGEKVARLGETEFAMLVEMPLDAPDSALRERAQAVHDCLQAPVRIGASEVFPLCVIGIASYPGDGEQPVALLEGAQTARLSATAEFNIVFCKPDSNAFAMREMRIESALREALAHDEFVLHYQPQLDLADGKVFGAEALLRWTSRELGSVSPVEFIPVAERSGLIGTIGDWVMRRACQQIAEWTAQGLPPLRISVNLSPTQLQRPGLAAQLQTLLMETGADPAGLCIELTEGTAMADVGQSATVLQEIKALGIEIALDDFGTGFSSLSCLRQLPIDVVKIDRSFVHDVTAAPEDVSVTRSIISMAHSLRLRVLAEGVETEGQLSLLVSHRCDQIQGWLFSRALAPDDFVQLLRDGRSLPERFHTKARRTRTLLLVDDEENILAALKRLFRRDGYDIVTATSADEGLRLLAKTEADVILSDQRMPGMTGTEFLRRAKELYPDSIRMVLSGYTELQSVIDAVNAGSVYKFLTKPWDDALLRGHVAEAFRRKDLDDENRRLSQQLTAANADYVALNARLEQVVEVQRTQAEVFARSASSLRDMLDLLPLPIFGVDPDGTLAFMNQEAEPLLPSAAGMLGCDLGLALPPDLVQALADEPEARGQVALAGAPYRVTTRPLPSAEGHGGRLVLLQPLLTTAVDA